MCFSKFIYYLNLNLHIIFTNIYIFKTLVDFLCILFLKNIFFFFFSLTNLKELHHCTDKLNISHKLIDYHGNYILACVPAILNLLSQSLGRRVHLIQMNQVPVKQVIYTYML